MLTFVDDTSLVLVGTLRMAVHDNGSLTERWNLAGEDSLALSSSRPCCH